MREAGERLLRTPSAISQSITGLERALDVQLFKRSGIRLELTEAGNRILQQVRSNERHLQSLLEDVRGEAASVRGRVTLGLPPGYPAVSMPAGLSAAMLAHPELQLRLRFFSHSELADGLQKGLLEIALSLQPLKRWNRKLRSTKLREENLLLAIPARYRYLCSGKPSELPIVDYYQKPLLIESWLKHHRQRGAKVKIRVFAANLDHVLQMARNGVGCAVVPRHIISSELASGELFEHTMDKRKPWIASVWLNSFHPPEKFSQGSRSVWDALLR